MHYVLNYFETISFIQHMNALRVLFIPRAANNNCDDSIADNMHYCCTQSNASPFNTSNRLKCHYYELNLMLSKKAGYHKTYT